MKSIKQLIENYEWPGFNSITFGNGDMVILEINYFGVSQYSITPIYDTTITSCLKYNDADLSKFDVSSTVTYKEYKILAGCGSYEGEGVVYVMNNDSLHWFAFFENSDPFVKVEVKETKFIHAITANNIIFKISIDNPLNIELIYPDLE